jgi:hypothetical protein
MVSMAVDDVFKENVKKVELRDEEALSPVDELSDVFSEVPARRHLRIIVRSPPAGESQFLWLSSSIMRCHRVSYYSKRVFPTAIS